MENMILTLLSLSNKKQALCNDDYKDNTQTFIQEKNEFCTCYILRQAIYNISADLISNLSVWCE